MIIYTYIAFITPCIRVFNKIRLAFLFCIIVIYLLCYCHFSSVHGPVYFSRVISFLFHCHFSSVSFLFSVISIMSLSFLFCLIVISILCHCSSVSLSFLWSDTKDVLPLKFHPGPLNNQLSLFVTTVKRYHGPVV
jgi:hypothetical protein